jgi:3-deoxy-D-manno-octulosonate 8-phosphate phosphatase KdsC-like HAD superfamily phosphatase
MKYAIERLIRISPEQAHRINAYRAAAVNANKDIPTGSAAIRELIDLGLEAAGTQTEAPQS